MPTLIKPGLRYPINRGLAQSLGVRHLFMFGEPGNYLRDLVGQASVAGGSGVTVQIGREGIEYSVAGAAGASVLATMNTTYGENIAVIARIKANAQQAANPGAAVGIYLSSSQSGFGVGFDNSATPNVGLQWLSSTGAGIGAYSAGALNTWYTVAAQVYITTGYIAYSWINGRPATTNQGVNYTGALRAVDEIAFFAQHRSTGYLRNLKGELLWAAVLEVPQSPMPDEFFFNLYAEDFPYNLFRMNYSNIFKAASGGSTYNNSLSETPSASSSFAAVNDIGTSLSESATPAEVVSGQRVIVSSVAESGSSVVDVAALVALAVSLSEAGTAADDAVAQVDWAGAVSESASPTAALATSMQTSSSLSESGVPVSTLEGATTIATAVSEAGSPVVSLVGTRLLSMTIAETPAASDDLVPDLSMVASVSESATPGSGFSTGTSYDETITESATASATVVVARLASVGVTETPAPDVGQVVIATFQNPIAETAAATAVVDGASIIGSAISESATPASTSSVARTCDVQLGETDAPVASASARCDWQSALTVTGSPSCSLDGVKTIVASITATVHPVEAVSDSGRIFLESIEESAIPADSLSGGGSGWDVSNQLTARLLRTNRR